MSKTPQKRQQWRDARDRKLRNYRIPRFGPTWEHDLTYPLRLENYRYGFNVNVSVSDLAHARAEYTRAQMLDILASGIDHVRYMFYIEEMTAAPDDPNLTAQALACIRFVVQTFLQYGINVILQVGSNGNAHKDLARQTTGWTQSGYNQFLVNLFNGCRDIPKFSPETVWLGIGNEMGDGVDDGHRSLSGYQTFLASATSALRAVARDYTFLYDLYPTAAADQWFFGSEFVPPSDKNTVCSVHFYHRMAFATDQGNGDTKITGQKWIYGFTWPMTTAQVGAYLATFTAGGLYGTGGPDGAAATLQINNWRDTYASTIGSDGFTDAAIDTYIAPLVAWCRSHRVALHCSEFGVTSELSSQFTLPESSALAWTAKVSTMLNGYGVGNCYWQYQDLTTGPSGSRLLSATKLARNKARRTIANGIRSL